MELKESSEEQRIREAYKRRKDDSLYSFYNPGYLFMVQARQKHLLALLGQAGANRLADKTMLEIGCGSGYWLREFIQWGASPANLCGVDLIADRVSVAAQLCPQGVLLSCQNAESLDVPAASFDIVCHFTAFSSILSADARKRVAAEMLRVVKSSGFILWYDFFMDNPRNPDVKGMDKTEIERLFPQCSIELQSTTLAPPIARFLAGFSTQLCTALELIPFLRTHYFGIIRKESAS